MQGRIRCFDRLEVFEGGYIVINKVEGFTEVEEEYTRIFACVYGIKPFISYLA